MICRVFNYYHLQLLQVILGEKYQWTFVIPQGHPQNEACTVTPSSGTGRLYGGANIPAYIDDAGCCITLPSKSSSGATWPDVVTDPTATVFAELLFYGSSVGGSDLDDLRDSVYDAIVSYLCPRQEKVWYVYTDVVIVSGMLW